MSKDKKKVLIVLGVVLGLVGVATLSYAFLSVGGKQNLANTFKSGCLSITIENESNAISLNGAYPITDVEGLSTEGYNFTINNTCSTSENYIINLENIDRQANSLSSDYLKISLNSDTFDNIITKLSSNEVTTPTISNAYEAYTIYKGKIEGNTTKTFKLREWLDYDATKEQAANKVIKNKINVIAKSDIETEELLGIKTDMASESFIGAVGGFKEIGNRKIGNVVNDETHPFSYNDETGEYTSTNKGSEGTASMIQFTPDKNYDNLGICYNLSSLENFSAFGVINMKTEEVLVQVIGGKENRCVNLGNVTVEDQLEVIYSSYLPNEEINTTKDEVTFYLEELKADQNKKVKYCMTNNNLCIPDTDITIFNNYINVSIVEDGKQIVCTSLDNGSTLCSNPNEINNHLIAVDKSYAMDGEFFDTNILRRQIESITTLDSTDIPEGVTSFDLSQKKNKSIMAWYRDTDNNGLYEVYIGQNGGVKANPNSSYLFLNLGNVTSIDLSHFNTSNVTNMSYMFTNNGLTNLDLSNFDTSNVTNMEGMFGNCSLLTSLDVSNFDTSNVTNMYGMFLGMDSLKSLDVSNFDTSNVTNMSVMFSNTSNLSSLKLDKATFNSVSSYSSMFEDSSVSTIYVKDTDAKDFINARLSEASKTANVITVS